MGLMKTIAPAKSDRVVIADIIRQKMSVFLSLSSLLANFLIFAGLTALTL
jgi:hypothetical protein